MMEGIYVGIIYVWWGIYVCGGMYVNGGMYLYGGINVYGGMFSSCMVYPRHNTFHRLSHNFLREQLTGSRFKTLLWLTSFNT